MAATPPSVPLRAVAAAILTVGCLLASGPRPAPTPSEAKSLSVIVQAEDLASAARAVESAGGTITHELPIIDAVGARLTAAQLETLRRSREARRVYANHAVEVSGAVRDDVETFYPALVGADRLHAEGIVGTGVTVAVLDTGLWAGIEADKWVSTNVHRQKRVLSRYNSLIDAAMVAGKQPSQDHRDDNGHGTHVTSVIASSRKDGKGRYNGIAPNVDLVVVTAFGEDGTGTYLDVIQGIDRVVRYKDAYKIRVLNLSFSAPPRSYYWDDPLNQAVMRAWRAGIVVVVSAGNAGPRPMTIGVPANVPYVITVGAMTDNYTPDRPADDLLASFSSTGPTVEGFVKPELVAPGGHMLGLLESDAELATSHPSYTHRGDYFTMSGTSQAAAVISGVAALMLQREPWLGPDEVKCRLMTSARLAVHPSGKPAYSVFQQGAGLVDAYEAVHGAASGCANQGLDVDLDLAGTAHYGGPVRQRADGSYYLLGLEGDGYVWDGRYLRGGGYLWSSASLWSDGYLWSGGYLWSNATLWSDAYLWSGAYLWSNGLTETMSTNKWVEQE